MSKAIIRAAIFPSKCAFPQTAVPASIKRFRKVDPWLLRQKMIAFQSIGEANIILINGVASTASFTFKGSGDTFSGWIQLENQGHSNIGDFPQADLKLK